MTNIETQSMHYSMWIQHSSFISNYAQVCNMQSSSTIITIYEHVTKKHFNQMVDVTKNRVSYIYILQDMTNFRRIKRKNKISPIQWFYIEPRIYYVGQRIQAMQITRTHQFPRRLEHRRKHC